jgi:esterase/lipase superfamily enzyme
MTKLILLVIGLSTLIPLTMSAQENVIEILNVAPGAAARSQEFTLEPDETLRVTAKPAGELQPALFIYEEAGLVGKNDEDSTAKDFVWRAPRAGKYRIVLYSNSDSAVEYRLSRLAPEAVRAPAATGTVLAQFPVYFATNRVVIASSPVVLGSDPIDKGGIRFGKLQVSIPLEHKLGQLELPSIWRLELNADPRRHFVAGSSQLMEGQTFYEDLARLASRSNEHDALVFIHGFNTSFEDASLRTAQLAYDLGFKGPAIFYTWPSQGKLADYIKDQRNADISAAPLRQLLTGLSQQAKIQRIHVIAHSMGNRVLAAGLSRGGELHANVREIALIAPDIDAALFQELAVQFPKNIGPITLYASSKDAALLASQHLAGYPRLGQGGKNMTVIPGIESVDASAVDTSALGMGHQYYADSRTILSDLYSFFRGQPACKRFSLRPSAEGRYWIFSP